MQIKKVILLFKLCPPQIAAKVLFKHFISRSLPSQHPDLHRLLIFINDCTRKGYRIRNVNEEYIDVYFQLSDKPLCMRLRKYTRDLIVFHQIFFQNDYLPIIDIVKSDLKTMVDAGANIGCSVLFFKVYFPEMVIVAIEPESSNYQLLLHNIERNFPNETRVTSIRKALYTDNSTIELRQVNMSKDAFHIMSSESLQDDSIDTVECITFEDIFSDYIESDSLDLLKMDIEGAEKDIFRDRESLDIMLPSLNILAIEVHENHISESEVISTLSKYAFKHVFKNGEYLISTKSKFETGN